MLIVPIVAAVEQLGIAVFLFMHEPMASIITAGWVGLGLLIYLLVGRSASTVHRPCCSNRACR